MNEIKIYKNQGANAIFIEDDNGAQFFNSIQAVILDPLSTKVSIYDKKDSKKDSKKVPKLTDKEIQDMIKFVV